MGVLKENKLYLGVVILNKISYFRGKHRFLSNFYLSPVEFGGLTYPTAEAAFQAQKCSDPADRVKYTRVKNPVKAKMMGKGETLPANWSQVSFDVMNAVLHSKFSDPELAGMLLATGDAYLEEGNHWHDNLWGRCTCEGCREKESRNNLGRILMGIRAELASGNN